MNVVWWSSDEGLARAQSDGVQIAASREAFFANSDVVSVHVRLKPDTHGIITASDFSQMQPGALFVNTSRSGLVAEGALTLSGSGRVSTPALSDERIEELAAMRGLIEPELAARALPRAHHALIDRLSLMNSQIAGSSRSRSSSSTCK